MATRPRLAPTGPVDAAETAVRGKETHKGARGA